MHKALRAVISSSALALGSDTKESKPTRQMRDKKSSSQEYPDQRLAFRRSYIFSDPTIKGGHVYRLEVDLHLP